MSEWFTVGIAKDGAKNVGRAGHDIAEIGGGILDEFRAARELFKGNPHEAAKKSWEGLGRSISGAVGTVARTGLAVGEFAAASAIALPELVIRTPGEAVKAGKNAFDDAVEDRAREIVQEELASARRSNSGVEATATAAPVPAAATSEASANRANIETEAEPSKADKHYKVKKDDNLWDIVEADYKASHNNQVDLKAISAKTAELKDRYGATIYPDMEIVL
jgi:hypothetical protein